jgi:hypothetical protein
VRPRDIEAEFVVQGSSRILSTWASRMPAVDLGL